MTSGTSPPAKVIGSLLSSALQPMLHSSGGTLALLCIWAAGLTLFTGWSG